MQRCGHDHSQTPSCQCEAPPRSSAALACPLFGLPFILFPELWGAQFVPHPCHKGLIAHLTHRRHSAPLSQGCFCQRGGLGLNFPLSEIPRGVCVPTKAPASCLCTSQRALHTLLHLGVLDGTRCLGSRLHSAAGPCMQHGSIHDYNVARRNGDSALLKLWPLLSLSGSVCGKESCTSI